MELTKMLALVAPVTMSADQQTLWLASAADALQDMRASEIADVSMQVRRSVTRPSHIVPEIAKLVAERRAARAERNRIKSENEALKAFPPVRRHIADRDRRTFKAADWAELNQYLEKMGSKVRYGPDGSKQVIGE
jgi:hypothetical protein